ncbi:MAG: hypothetical protein J6K50_04705 [Clostridia bacterium]|nr:hypothetical protein [Clostridia bacterium]
MFPVSEVEKRIGYVFHNKNLLEEAFTHSTYAHLHGGRDNDRLEYLGDAVLELVVTEWQFRGDPQASAGKLTGERQKLVCKNALDTAIDGLGVWGYLLFEGSEENLKGKPKSSLFEALTAAIYLDGGYKAAKAFILEHGNLGCAKEETNHIGLLKEFLEKRGQAMPQEQMERSGRDNAPTFHCTLTALGESAEGEGKTKREAKATASARLLWELQKKEENAGLQAKRKNKKK